MVPVATRPQLELLRYALTHAEGEDPALFLPWQNVRRDLREACKRTGIPPCSPNDLRRTFATWLRAAGAPTDLIAPVMGHADTRMVERVYGRLAPSDLRRRIDGLRGRSRCVTGVSDTVEALGLFAPSGRPAPRRRSFKFACFPVPRDGVEPPTRGFSNPAEAAGDAVNSIVLEGGGTPMGHARGLDAAITAQALGALDAGLADVAQGLLRTLLRRQLGR
nr:tyrosine-type recombinase/integrase [Deltaproteobacteria bacterium]